MSARLPMNEDDFADEDNGKPIPFYMGEGENEEPLSFKDFNHEIDTRSGFFSEEAKFLDNFEDDLQDALDEEYSKTFIKEHFLEHNYKFEQFK